MPRTFHNLPGFGSSIFSYPTSKASGAVMHPDEVGTNEYATRKTAPGVYICNAEDVHSIAGPAKMSKLVANGTAWEPVPSGGNMLRRQAIVIYNTGPSTVYVHHNNTDTITEAFPIVQGGSISFDLLSYHQLYARTATGGDSDVRIVEVM